MASKSKELDVNVKSMIIQPRNEGSTYRAVGIQLNISLFTVRSVVKKFNETGCPENKVRSGRPGIFSAREKRSIIKEVKKNPKINAPKKPKKLLILRIKLLVYRLYGMFYMKKVIMEEQLERNLSFRKETEERDWILQNLMLIYQMSFGTQLFFPTNRSLTFSGVMDDNMCGESQTPNWKNNI
ncbi:hypothetical protein TNCV_4354291 [Trichonephila clavipes]|nr:hypothetical protein TNCV_4354291 [Trichonephila clavipes]